MNNQQIIEKISIELPKLQELKFSHYDEPSNRQRYFTAVNENNLPIVVLVSNEDVDDVFQVYISDNKDDLHHKSTFTL